MKKYIVFLVILFLQSQLLLSQAPSTQGKEFWVSFMKNYEFDPDLKLIISGKRNCSGIVKNAATNTVISTFTITAGQLTNISIPNNYSSRVSETIEDLGIVVSSSDTISLYASNFESATFDVTNVLPTNALSDTYRIQTYPTSTGGAEFMIVATEDNTVVDIMPTALTMNGNAVNKNFAVTLNKGQVYQVITKSVSGDFSGSLIKSRDCKKIAVFNGNVCANIPSSCFACDHLVEQAFPVYNWGKRFAITNSVGRTYDQVRVTASKDGTKITKNGSLLATIDMGQTYEFSITSQEKSCYIETSQPCAVNLYFIGGSCGGSTNGDPSSVWISPIEQKINEITFGTFQTERTQSHYVNIVTHKAGVSSMTLDDKNIASQFTSLQGDTTLVFARIPIIYGAHTLKNSTGFTAYVYGYGYYESYGYSVGSSAVDLNKQILVDGNSSSQISLKQEFCVNNTISFKPDVDFLYSGILWDFGDGQQSNLDKETHTYSAPGIYQARMIMTHTESTCNGEMKDTVSVKLNVVKKSATFSDEICKGLKYIQYGFNNLIQNDTTLMRTITSVAGCDSSIIVNLKVKQPTYSITKAVICQGDKFIFNGKTYTQQGSYATILVNRVGCDSIATLQLTVNPSYDLKDSRTICSDELPYAYGDTIFQRGTQTNYYPLYRKTIYGCDSITILHFIVHPVKITTLSDTTVQNKAYTKYNYDIPSQPNFGNFTFYQHLKTVFGCDSTVVLNLRVSPDFSATMRTSPRICADEKDFTLNYDIDYGNIEQHSVVFDAKAKEEGFEDIVKQTSNGSYIDVPLPLDVLPAIYTASVVFDNGPITKSLPIRFTVNYPSSVILQRWNDVLALYNSSYNGGYTFTDYQWYKNGQAIDGATKSYLYLAHGKLDTSAEYNVKITRVSDGVTLFTCPVVPTLHTDIAVYPTLISKASQLIVKIEGTGTARLLNISGLPVKEQMLHTGENILDAPNTVGTYLLLIINEKGESRKQLLIVK
ncbi:MAG: PKD domain-containing protein [Bacteroidota bacterium]|nr:PKD domain-containing protein [Bacteroidota bacterium]MDP4270750.1 PKD domain-containing protein [Bacteroidota bacterium]